MQSIFSKVNGEKRRLYGENGILGHRRAISTTIPSNSPCTGHRRTYSNRSSDFKMIFSNSPTLSKQFEHLETGQITEKQNPESFQKFLKSIADYFLNNTVPKHLLTPNQALLNEISRISNNILNLQQENIKLTNKKAENKSKLKENIETQKKSENFLISLKKQTNDLEIALKSTQEALKLEKAFTSDLMKKMESIEVTEKKWLYSLEISNEKFTKSLSPK
jgi:hypothetical protein